MKNVENKPYCGEEVTENILPTQQNKKCSLVKDGCPWFWCRLSDRCLWGNGCKVQCSPNPCKVCADSGRCIRGETRG